MALDRNKVLQQCRMDDWTARDGLPPRAVEAIVQTPDGYLWLATRAGLVRFDGVTFKVFNTENTPGMTREMIVALFVAPDGSLWVGTDGGGFGRFRDGRFERFPLSDTQSWSQFLAFHQSQDGTLWVAGQGQYGLIQIIQGQKFSSKNNYDNVIAIQEDGAHNLWFATRWSGLLEYGHDGRWQTYSADNHLLPVNELSALCADPDGSLWIGTDHQGLCHREGGKLTTYTVSDGLASNEILSLLRDREGILWIGTTDGINRWDGRQFTSFRYVDGLTGHSIRALLEDRQGNLWAGTERGLTRFSSTKLTPFALNFGGHPAPINAACAAADGSLWFATLEGLVRLWRGKIQHWTTHEGLPDNRLMAVSAAPDGTLWFLDSSGNLMRLEHGRFTHCMNAPGCTKVITDAHEVILAEPDKLYRYLNGRLMPIPYTTPIRDNNIFQLHRSPDGVLWIACFGLGVVRNGHWSVLHDGLLPGTHVLGIADDADGSLWLCTDKGLAHYQSGRFTRYGTQDGLPDDNLFEIQRDAQGTLWIGCNKGIFRLRTQDLARFDAHFITKLPVTLYDYTDGIRDFPLSTDSVKALDGNLWFLGDHGLTIVDPDHIPGAAPCPSVLIEQVQVKHRSYAPHTTAFFPPGSNDIDFRFTVPGASVPEKVRFRYRLEGYDGADVDAGTRRTASYTNLAPGTYTFRVIACNEDGIWSDWNEGTPGENSYRFTIRPYFYQTVWFGAVGAMFGAALLGGGVKVRLQQLARSNRLLEAKVREHTAQLHAAYVSLEASSAQLAVLATTDGLTGVANHRTFHERLAEELARARFNGRPTTVLLLDVDSFKAYNDSFGHLAGDEVLRILGQLLQQSVRANDFVARYGGEEFAVLLPETTLSQAREVAERICDAVARHAFPNRAVTVSIGLSQTMDSCQPAEHLVQNADLALYAAKHEGRNRVAVHPVA